MKKLLVWHGRVGRAEFFSYSFGLGVLNAVIGLIVGYLPSSILSNLLAVAISLFFAYLELCLVIRRIHDLNKPGWYYFAFLGIMLSLFYIGQAAVYAAIYLAIPIALIASIVIYFVKGTDGGNQYGPDPLALTIAVTSEDTTSE